MAAQGVRPFKPRHYSALWFAYFGALGLYNPYAPLWLQSLGLSTLAIGAFASLMSWTRVVGPYGWAWVADHGASRVRLLRLASALCVLGCGALLLARPFGAWAMAAAVALMFLCNSAVSPLSESVVLRHLHDGDGLDARRYARTRVWGSVGFVVSVMAAGYVLQWVGIGWLPWLTLGAFLTLLLASLRLADEPAQTQDAKRVPVWPVLRRVPVQWFFAGTMLTVLAHTGQYSFFSLYLTELGYSKGAIGLMWAASVVAEIVFFVFGGRWFSRLPDTHWLQLAALVAALRFAFTAALGGQVWVLALLQLTHAITFGVHHMACTSALGRHFEGPLRSRGSALYTTLGYGVPGVAGGLSYGALSEGFGLVAVFWVSGLAALGGWVCYGFGARCERREQDRPASST